MLKVFLVEDEFIVREGIKNNIDWAGEGFEFCGDAADGELAYPLIQSTQPDIIITDIKMPFMNGLELSRLVLKELPQSKIIILSGHEEFSYAQEAIKIGVTEYLLKPIKASELIKTVKRIGNQIIQERIEIESYKRYKQEMEENETQARIKLFNDMVSGSLSIVNIIEQGKKLGLSLSSKLYQIVLFKYSITDCEDAYSKEMLSLEKQLNNIYIQFNSVIVFDRSIEGVAFLLKGENSQQLDSTRTEFFDAIEKVLSKYPRVRYFGGAGKPVDRLTSLLASYESAARAFSHRFFSDKKAIICYNELHDRETRESSTETLSSFKIGSLDLKKADAFLRNGEADEIGYFVEEFLKDIGAAGEKSLLFKQYILMDIYFTIVSFLKDIGATDVYIEEPFQDSEGMNEIFYDKHRLKEYIIKVFSTAINHRDALRTKRYHRIIEQAKEYINQHYTDENISLNDTAAYVNFSPSHFSSVFSRETGKSFIRYLTDLRMGKARELLKCTDLRCSDISAAVGYKDPHYFSYIFKKIHNCSPTQYRTSKK